MEIKTFYDLIEWTRELHAKLAKCLAHCASRHGDERASMLLEYLASHETEMEKMVAAFERQADPKAAHTYVYDYIPHNPITTHLDCDDHYAKLDADAISAEVFDFHEQIIDLYQSLVGKAEIREAAELVQSLLAMEEHETKRLVRQVERMDDL
ncbi:ATPase [Parahaliea mediterranea]|uniref:ATPase n=1 Tax=Parahaliea mediterranea TaxID=651086 RepID=UPI000C0941D0|nr:ATPase [Parahaliea mediterranea]MAC33280.1 ATPase [Haliea sp.]|tara:strand:+ start:10933 stop:11391 length:459 start_codon:yes stop_codon:yes gene_type:complete